MDKLAVDTFELIIDPADRVYWPGGGSFQPGKILINHVPFIDLVRAAEEPWARAEYLARLSEFENPDEFLFEPGDYLYLPVNMVVRPSGEWTGSPAHHGFRLDDSDPRNGKATILGCTCSVIECWFLQARIEVGPDLVTWSDFGQFHRPDWQYDLGPFQFDRTQYEEQLSQEGSHPSSG